MRVLVLGAGVVGLATAYHLWKDGAEVLVVERHAGAGMESSFGNAGGLCPGFAGPWAAPGMVAKVLRMALSADAPIRFSLMPERQRMRWVRQWMRNCTAPRFRINKLRMQRVAHYSYACLKQLVAEAPIDDFDFHQDGVLQVFRTPGELELGHLAARALEEQGVAWKMLDAAQVRAAEPALARSAVALVGALQLPGDACGDSHKFALQLARFLAARGVQMRFGTAITRLRPQGDRIVAVETDDGAVDADDFVVALGSQAPRLLAPLGIRLPVYPLKGYSITVPLQAGQAGIGAAIMDEHHKVMISRLGGRIRAAGMAELVGYSTAPDVRREAFLTRVVREFLPDGLDFSQVQGWAGLRPMTPDGPPILGHTPWRNLFLNSGHGSNGWTQSCGTGKIVADIIAGRAPAIDMEGLTLERFAA